MKKILLYVLLIATTCGLANGGEKADGFAAVQDNLTAASERLSKYLTNQPLETPSLSKPEPVTNAGFNALATVEHAAVDKPVNPKTDIVRPGDKINILVYREPELTRFFSQTSVGFTVDAFGDLDYPLLGKIRASGRTLKGLQEFIQRSLGENYLVNPQVQVNFHEQSFNNSVSVMGQVRRPGNYLFTPDMTLTRVISEAGGFNQVDQGVDEIVILAEATQVAVTRRSLEGIQTTMIINVESIIEGKIEDFALEPGDLVFVPEMSATTNVSILGQVTKPGNYLLTSGMTLVRLISEAEGLTRYAAPDRVVLSRKSADGKSESVHINAQAIFLGRKPDIELQPGDAVYVPESIF